MNEADYKVFKHFPKNAHISNKKTMDGLTRTYDIERKGQKPFYKYQLSLMKQILVFLERLTKTVNVRFIYTGLADFYPTIMKHFTKRGYKWQRVDDSIEWLNTNLRY